MDIPKNAIPDGYELVAMWYIMRHGEKDEDGYLTEIGELEVEATSEAYFGELGFTAAFHSEEFRTIASVQIALQHCATPDVTAEVEEGFKIDWIMTDESAIREAKEIRERLGEAATAADWLQKWRKAPEIRRALQGTILTITRRLPRRGSYGEQEVPTFLVGYHEPAAGFAADNPRDIGPIKTADVVEYFVSRNAAGKYYFHAQHLRCPIHD